MAKSQVLEHQSARVLVHAACASPDNANVRTTANAAIVLTVSAVESRLDVLSRFWYQIVRPHGLTQALAAGLPAARHFLMR